MRRDWYWRSGAKPSDRHSARTRTRTRTALPGCITAVFHLFQSHRFHCPFSRGNGNTSVKPRNCLESEEEPSASLASTCNEDDILNIPMGIQIKTKVGGPGNDTPGAGTNTPTLVARLMGLDLLPEPHSRSLPVTPRTSSARRSDADRHHRPRLSLQINKENVSPADELIMSRLSSLTKRKELKREYETVKQSVTRKVGMNITNTVRNREELVSRSSTVKNSTNSGSKLPESPRIQKQTSHKLQAVEEEQKKQQNQQQPSAARKCKKGSNKKLVSRLKKPQQASEITRNKKEEPLVRRPTANRVNIPDKKCRKTPLSNELLNAKVPTLVLVKRIQQKQVLAAQSPTQTYIKHMLRSRIRSFRRSDCRVLEDIDALVGRDTPDVELRSVMAAYEEQGEGIVAEIEKDMLEALVFELYEA